MQICLQLTIDKHSVHCKLEQCDTGIARKSRVTTSITDHSTQNNLGAALRKESFVAESAKGNYEVVFERLESLHIVTSHGGKEEASHFSLESSI